MEESNTGFFAKYWKWILGGAVVLVLIVLLMKRGGSAVPAAPGAGTGGTAAPTIDLSPVAQAISANSESSNQQFATLSALIADQNKQEADMLKGYQDSITSLIGSLKPPASTPPKSGGGDVHILPYPYPTPKQDKGTDYTDVKPSPPIASAPPSTTANPAANAITPSTVTLNVWHDDNAKAGYQSTQVTVKNDYDKQIYEAKQRYETAEKAGDASGMKTAHDEAEKIRKEHPDEISDWAKNGSGQQVVAYTTSKAKAV